MKPSKRIQKMQASPIRKLVPFADKAKKNGTKVFHLNIGQPDIETPHVFWDAIHKFEERVLSYSHSQGLPEYHASTIEYYKNNNIELEEDELIITTGGSESILFALMACCEHGDEVIVFEPFYTNYNGFATIAGVKLVPVTTYAEDGFDLPSVAEIEKKITSKTSAIMICNPNNPTGSVYTREKLSQLAELVKRKDLFLLSDEVYREFTYEGKKHVSVMEFPVIAQNAIMLDSISKRYSACGARLGSLATKNKEIVKEVMKLAQARLCAPTLEQVGATEMNKQLGADYFAETVEEYQKRRDIVMSYLEHEHDIVCLTPGGAFYIIAKLPIKDSNHFAQWMLEKYSDNNETTMVAPAGGFYASENQGNDEIRIAYILKEKNLKRAMEILLKGLRQYIANGEK